MARMTAVEIAKQVRITSDGIKRAKEQEVTDTLSEVDMAGFFDRVSPLVEAGWTRPEPEWPRPVVVRNVTDECVFAVLPEEDGVRLQLMLVGLDRQEDPYFDAAGEILSFVAEVEKELSAIIA